MTRHCYINFFLFGADENAICQLNDEEVRRFEEIMIIVDPKIDNFFIQNEINKLQLEQQVAAKDFHVEEVVSGWDPAKGSITDFINRKFFELVLEKILTFPLGQKPE